MEGVEDNGISWRGAEQAVNDLGTTNQRIVWFGKFQGMQNCQSISCLGKIVIVHESVN